MDGALNHLRWPSLARDLAVMTVPDAPTVSLESLCKTYGLTQETLAQTILHPEFRQLFQQELDYCRSLGSKAGKIYRFSALGQALSEKLYNDAMNGEFEAKDALKLLELLLKAAGMMDQKEQQVNVQTNVGISLPLPTGLNNPKLKHLEAANVPV